MDIYCTVYCIVFIYHKIEKLQVFVIIYNYKSSQTIQLALSYYLDEYQGTTRNLFSPSTEASAIIY